MNSRCSVKHCFMALAFCSLIALGGPFKIAQAQTPTGAIDGRVTDPSGAVIPGATVTISEAATGRSITLVTNENGLYSARNLLPGVYTIKVEAKGFSSKETQNVPVNSGSVVNGNVVLALGQVGEVVQVTAGQVSVDTVRQTVDSVVTENEIKNLPSFSRNFLDLASLAPGAVIRDGEAIDPTKAFAYRAVGINGRSGTGTRVQVDGIDITDETVGTTLSNLSQDAVREFQLTRSSLDISTSLTSSGAINIISRTGENHLHGSTFFDYYNQDLGARLNYNKEGEPFNRKRTGVSVGGPFAKDKLFWFVNWERHYQTEQKIFESPEFPQQNGSVGFPVGIRYASGRLDWNAAPTMRAFYRFNHSWDVSSGGTVVSPFQNLDWTNTDTVGLDVNRSKMTHSIRFGYVNFNNQIVSQSLGKPFLTSNGIPYYLGVGTFQTGPNSLAPQETYQDNWQTSYDGTMLRGKHTLRFGASFTHIVLGGYANFTGPLQVFGIYDAATIAALKSRGANVQDPLEYPLDSFATGPPNGFFTVKPAHGFPHGGHFNNRTAWFAGDSFKATRRLTVNLGVRWQYDSGFFSNDHNVRRDPALDMWIKGASVFPAQPKNLYSPSFGFAYDLTGEGKTVIRGGFYKAYEMNIYNNTIFDESAMIPAGIGPDSYDITGVFGPDGTPINVDGNHPDGNYEDLIGQPIKNVIGTIAQVHKALGAAYSTYAFDPSKGSSLFTQTKGLQIAAMIPGNQFKIPYALQYNIGIQRELSRGTVLQADFVVNHGIGLPMLYSDFERRRDAGTLNVAAARAQRDRVLGLLSVDQYLAANPTATIGAFSLVNDTIWQGMTGTAYTRAEFNVGGFSLYKGLQLSLRGNRASLWKLRAPGYYVSYALARSEATQGAGRVEFRAATQDNRAWNSLFGPNGLDFTHILGASSSFTIPSGLRLHSSWSFRTAPPISLFVPNLGGAISGAQGFFGTDLNGDGGRGTTARGDVLPGLGIGQFGRSVKSFDDLNQIISTFNSTYSGKLTPHGRALVDAGLFTEAQLVKLGAVVKSIPLIPAGVPYPFHNQLLANLRVDRPVRIREGMHLTGFADVFNLFNHAPQGTYGGLAARFGSYNFDYANAPVGSQASDLTLQRGRIASTRRVQVGVKFEF